MADGCESEPNGTGAGKRTGRKTPLSAILRLTAAGFQVDTVLQACNASCLSGSLRLCATSDHKKNLCLALCTRDYLDARPEKLEHPPSVPGSLFKRLQAALSMIQSSRTSKREEALEENSPSEPPLSVRIDTISDSHLLT